MLRDEEMAAVMIAGVDEGDEGDGVDVLTSSTRVWAN